MPQSHQLTVGPKLLSDSREAWLGYYVFALLTVAVFGAGAYWLARQGFGDPLYALKLLAVLILGTVCAGVALTCHLLGHIIDALAPARAPAAAQAPD